MLYYKNFGGKVFIVQQARGASYNWYLAKIKIFLLLRVLYYINLDNAGALNQCILWMHFTRIWKCGSQNKLRVLHQIFALLVYYTPPPIIECWPLGDDAGATTCWRGNLHSFNLSYCSVGQANLRRWWQMLNLTMSQLPGEDRCLQCIHCGSFSIINSGRVLRWLTQIPGPRALYKS